MSFLPEITYDAENKIWSNSTPVIDYYSSNLSVGDIIFNETRRHPQLIAQISDTENTVLTNDDMHKNSMRVASYMRKLGLQQSDVVGIIARNTTHITAVVYACFFNGIAFHALNVKFEQEKIEKLFNITKASLIFCDGDEYEKVRAATANTNVIIVTMRNHKNDSISIEKVLATPIEEGFKPARLEKGSDQTLAILCSSGTTGIPKAVPITNNQLMFNLSNLVPSSNVFYGQSTLDWFSGIFATLLSGYNSLTRVIADNDFDPVRMLKIIEKYKISWINLGVSQICQIVNSEEFLKTDFSSMRTFFYGGSSCSLQVQQKLRSRLPMDCLRLSYGFTELGNMATSNLHFDEKPNSCGRLTSGMKMKILNEEGKTLGANEVGEICIYSGRNWPGYYGNTEESRSIYDSEHWFHSGDLGYVDDDGFLFIVDRIKDMLKCQRMTYFPHEIESVIAEMPDVVDVCVFGVWSDLNGDEPAAVVVKKLGSNLQAQDVVDYVKEHVKVDYKQLLGGALIVEDLKRTPNGKTNRRANKQHFLKVVAEK